MPKPLSALELIASEAGTKSAARRRSTLARSPAEDAGALDERRIAAAKSPLEMAGRTRARPVELVPNVMGPEVPRGEALDLSSLGSWDLAHHSPLERKAPTKVSDRAKTAYTAENTRDFENYVRRGIREGGLNWYDLSPLSRVALQEMPPEDFATLMAMNAASSARSSVQDQIKRASLAWYMKHQGLEWPMSNVELTRQNEGYGHLAHDIHSKHLAPLVAGERPNFSPTEQPKYASYFGNFLGNVAPLTADTHYQALHGFPMKKTWNKMAGDYVEMPDFSKDVDYPFAESFSGERARRMGIPLSAYQSSAWVGGREATGVRDARPFTAVYDEMIARTAQQLDISPKEAMLKHLRGEIPLMPIAKAEGGLALAGGGAPASIALRDYVRKRLPKRFDSEELRHVQDLHGRASADDPVDPSNPSYGGSGRDVFALGPDKLVKLAKRPRGLYEQSLEGFEPVQENLPRLHWRSPDNELTVVERMPLTPTASEEYMGPMRDRVYDLKNSSRIPAYRRHRDDPHLRGMMEDRGLESFLPMNIHSGDFFLSPQSHWALRDPKMRMGEPWWRGKPTLLDPGALDYRITNDEFENSFAGKFRDVLDERMKLLLPKRFYAKPEEIIANALGTRGGRGTLDALGIGKGTEEFVGPYSRFRQRPNSFSEAMQAFDDYEQPSIHPPRLSGGMSTGGLAERLRSLRAHLAGGGTPRNWLRGVKGSKFDKILGDLKKRYAPEKHEDMFPGDEANPGIAQQLEREKYTRQWIDTNLANYITRQMGTPGDPLEQALAGQQRLALTKFAPGEVEKHVFGDAPRGLANPRSGREKAENARLLSQYNEGVEDFRANMPPWLKSLYEQDQPRIALEARRKDKYGKPTAKYVPDVGHLHDLDEGGWSGYMADPVHGILDWMQQSGIPPERLGRVSVPQALESSKQWHEQLARKAEEKKLQALAGGQWMKEHKAYPTGFKWLEYDPSYATPTEGVIMKGQVDEKKYMELRDALEAEGEVMGHCVGGYCDRVVDGSTRILSLRDAKGRPHVTVEVQPSDDLSQVQVAKLRPDIIKGFTDQATGFDESGAPRKGLALQAYIEKHHPEFVEESTRPGIVQIKGKGNKKPADEYLPYVQDLVASGKWDPNIGDFRNTGLVRLKSRAGAGDMFSRPEDVAPFRRYLLKSQAQVPGAREGVKQDMTHWLTEDEMVERNKQFQAKGLPQGDELRKYLSGMSEDMRDRTWRYDLPKDWTPPPIGFAEGGAVTAAAFPKESANEQLMRAEFALSLLMAERESASQEEIPALEREIYRVQAIIDRLKGAGVASESRVKESPAASQAEAPVAPAVLSGSAAPTGAPGADDDLFEETLGMLGRFATGDATSKNFLAQLLGDQVSRT